MNIAQRLDRLPLTRTHWTIVMVTGIGWLFDSMDVGLITFLMPSIQKEWGLLPTQLGLIGSIGMAGMAVGAAASGMVADRWGRRNVILLTLILFGLFTGLCGLSTGLVMLMTARFFVGAGLGGELPVASTLVSEFSPSKVRGRLVVILESFWAWGWIAAAMVAYLLVPLYGWRVAFFIGAIPALYAAYLRRAIPESPLFLERQGRFEEADSIVTKMEEEAGVVTVEKERGHFNKGSGTTLSDLWSGQHWRSTLTTWVLWVGMNFGYYGFVTWIPTLLVNAKGFIIIKSLKYVLLMSFAQLPGYFSAAWLIEKIGRKAVLIVYLAGTALSAYFFGQSNSVNDILTWGCLLYFFSLGAWGCVYAYTPENYPTGARGTGVGWAAAVGRVGAIAAPYAVGLLYQTYGKDVGYTSVFFLLTLVFAVTALVVWIFGTETMGKTFNELEAH